MATANDLAQLVTQLTQLAQTLASQSQEPEPPPTRRPMPERVLLTVEEAAERLGIGRTMAFRLVGTGEIASVQIGRLRRVPKSAIYEYAAALLRATASDAA